MESVSYRQHVAVAAISARTAGAPSPILPDGCTSIPDVVPCFPTVAWSGSIDKRVVVNRFRDGSG